MSSVVVPPTPPLELITIESRKVGSHGSCKVHTPVNLAPTRRYRYRMIALALVHVYIAFHLISWHVFGIEIWGKTAMMGVPSLAKGTINTAAIMVLLILGSILIFGRGFCGWVCHIRGLGASQAEDRALPKDTGQKSSHQYTSSLAIKNRGSLCPPIACHHSNTQCWVCTEGQPHVAATTCGLARI